MTARIANRNGEPAWKNAPPRLRQSQIERPLETPRPNWFARIMGKRDG